mmetsp:Transcript_25710/g.102603  ORF Transcript_25710/g.102603 Transcript_25710/m.102603 type:complete len:216 (+) Transcript_25710:2310-2957(+)
MRRSPPSSCLPSASANCFLWSGQAILSVVPPVTPTTPCASTKACLCGHMFCVANHSPALVRNTASCDSPYRTGVPRPTGKSAAGPTSTHEVCERAKTASSGARQLVCGAPSAGQSTGRRWPRTSSKAIMSLALWRVSVLTNCLANLARSLSSLTTTDHSSWYVSTTCCMRASNSALMPSLSSMMTSLSARSRTSSFGPSRSNQRAVRSSRSPVRQ